MLLALDCAASEFYKDGSYVLAGEGLTLSSEGFTDYLATLADKFPIVSIEDAMAENDWAGWKHLSDALGERSSWSATIFRDQHEDPATGHRPGGIANSILIKINQIGTSRKPSLRSRWPSARVTPR